MLIMQNIKKKQGAHALKVFFDLKWQRKKEYGQNNIIIIKAKCNF